MQGWHTGAACSRETIDHEDKSALKKKKKLDFEKSPSTRLVEPATSSSPTKMSVNHVMSSRTQLALGLGEGHPQPHGHQTVPKLRGTIWMKCTSTKGEGGSTTIERPANPFMIWEYLTQLLEDTVSLQQRQQKSR